MTSFLFINVGGMLELSEAIRDFHDHTDLPQMVSYQLLISISILTILTHTHHRGFLFMTYWLMKSTITGSCIYSLFFFGGTIHLFKDHFVFLFQNNGGSADEFFLVTNPQSSGSPPKRAPPPVTVLTPPPVPVTTPPPVFAPSPIVSAASGSESFNSTQERELTVDDIEDFEEDDDIKEINSNPVSRRRLNDATDLMVKLPSFTTGNDI